MVMLKVVLAHFLLAALAASQPLTCDPKEFRRATFVAGTKTTFGSCDDCCNGFDASGTCLKFGDGADDWDRHDATVTPAIRRRDDGAFFLQLRVATTSWFVREFSYTLQTTRLTFHPAVDAIDCDKESPQDVCQGTATFESGPFDDLGDLKDALVSSEEGGDGAYFGGDDDDVFEHVPPFHIYVALTTAVSFDYGLVEETHGPDPNANLVVPLPPAVHDMFVENRLKSDDDFLDPPAFFKQHLFCITFAIDYSPQYGQLAQKTWTDIIHPSLALDGHDEEVMADRR
mmetsp:Transcript_3005/g.10010  ORF Transcript_3005/g.10010 Transcript_3005/m.10010 type:complete len:286 (-) Transcript_3005:228-1085(-)